MFNLKPPSPIPHRFGISAYKIYSTESLLNNKYDAQFQLLASATLHPRQLRTGTDSVRVMQWLSLERGLQDLDILKLAFFNNLQLLTGVARQSNHKKRHLSTDVEIFMMNDLCGSDYHHPNYTSHQIGLA